MAVSNSDAAVAAGHSPGIQYTAAAAVLFLTLLGSHLATPLYPHWQDVFGLTTAHITMVFACYPIGVTIGLLFGGRLGDQVGRRPMVLVGILLTACSSLVYLMASGMGHLVAARLLNGLAIGLLSGPAVAAIVELHPTGDKAAASRIGAIATLAAPAAGLLMATLVVHFAAIGMIATLPFLIQLCGLALALGLLLVYRETLLPHNRRTFGVASFAPQGLWVPEEIRAPFTFAAVTGALAWANTGLWLALGPAMVSDVIGSNDGLLSGLAVVGFLTMAGLVQLFTRGMGYRRAISLGLGLIPPSLVLICATLLWRSGLGLFCGAVLAGMAQGLSWMGCSELTNRIAPTGLRASVLSTLYIAGYFGAAIPVVATGFIADWLGLFPAIVLMAAVFVILAVVLLLQNMRFGRAEWFAPPPPPAT
ncbi:MAG: MFS transporter [Rhizobiaceae bacterium]|nr:MFS transporter [Rhizobiaceae bacterium]MCV0404941.1 MFS transporter [Rhizobiaceae bacterium]